ncbi:MAG: methyltransferase domain-containing protein [Candidatus Woesearchaeota archaeon]
MEEDFLEKNALVYDKERFNGYMIKATNKILSLIDKYKVNKNRMLEIGVGTGELIKKTEPMFKEAYGIDLSKNMVGVARNKVKKAHLLVGDAEHLMFKAESFDFVVSMDILEHVGDPLKVMNEVIRVLKNRGLAFLSTPNPLWAPVMWLAEKLHLKVKEGKHKYIFLPKYAKRLSNADVLYSGYVAYLPFRFNSRIEESLSRFLLTKYLGFNFMLVIKKKATPPIEKTSG